MTLVKGRAVAGTSKQVKRGPVSVNQMKNGEEILQYHKGRLKVIRKEFGKIFELEYSSPEVQELKTFAKFSDLKKPQRDAIKIIKEGVRIGAGAGKKTFIKIAEDGDTVASGETQIITTGSNAGKIIIP
tara:strand:- start:2038 stop:2424 length:387 start_codon:yes stop_codon:yes gene_type:complete